MTGFLYPAVVFCVFSLPVTNAFSCDDFKNNEQHPAAVGKAVVHPETKVKPVSSGNDSSRNLDTIKKTVVLSADEQKPTRVQSKQAPKFDMDGLISRLKKSHAIGIFTKLALRSDALDLIDLVKAWRRHMRKISLQEVRARYNGLLLKVLALLDDDPELSRDISLARESIWKSLMEVKT